MSVNLTGTIKKLIKALNSQGYSLVYDANEFMGFDKNAHKYYVLNQAVYDDVKHKYQNVKIYGTSGQLRMVFFLRDLWYLHTEQELPTDQALWNSLREKEIDKMRELVHARKEAQLHG